MTHSIHAEIFPSAPLSSSFSDPWSFLAPTASLILSSGKILQGWAIGATGTAQGELCFNTAMTGYEEILTDPSYAGQIVTFTFPHIGNVGSNEEDVETVHLTQTKGVQGVVLHAPPSAASNYRSLCHFDNWLKLRGIVGICGVDTRALTIAIRTYGMPMAILAHHTPAFDPQKLQEEVRMLPSLEGQDLAQTVTSSAPYSWTETAWKWQEGYGQQLGKAAELCHVVVLDFGVKRNILRLLAQEGCRITVLPAHTTAEEICAYAPDGVFLSNGPGDPAATAVSVIPQIRKLLEREVPIFGICLGHQILALALGGTTFRMHQGHHGANHPVRDLTTGKIEICSMNHGFAVAADSLPETVLQTHLSLFDGSNCGLRLKGRPVFSVQHHPEASPGPCDSHYLFQKFVAMMRGARKTERSESWEDTRS